MVLCNTCMNYSKEHDEFRQQYDDVIDGDKLEKHYCPMYDDHIPHDIFHKGSDCPFYVKKGR